VARWRDDVDFVQAGIYCFQPYVVTGELEPPANPLICPQFCVRFNDLDNIGITGRHYSGFVMLGIQVFNKPNDKKFWADECVEFNFRWLTEELMIPPEEITFIEDVWAGGGNLGPSIEYFVSGLEVGNMVFMQYKTFPDGSREPLQIQVIDVGIGLERIPWLINGSATSYLDVFPTGFKILTDRVNLARNSEIWDKFGPLSCLLNVDEVDDLSKTWAWIAEQVGSPVAEVRAAIEPIRDAYLVLDHTRTCLMTIQDGSLPANTGGGSNIRNVLRRAFAILNKNGWFEPLGGVQGILDLCEAHKKDLADLYGEFPPYSSFAEIITREYRLYKSHDEEQRKKLDQLLKKQKGALTLDDWIRCVTSFGVPADLIAQVTGQDVPLNLWYEIDYRQQQTAKAQPTVLYQTAHLEPTVSLYDDDHDHREYEFSGAKVLDVMPVMTDAARPLGMVVLDRSPFYPTSGGQDHDTGSLIIDGKTYEVVDVIRVGPCVLHQISPAVASADELVGKSVSGSIDGGRRDQLRVHHTATHLIYATARRVLGPHVWQNGARKKVTEAHLDITHYAALTHEQINEIEREANRIVRSARSITKNTQSKDDAEKKYGFHLYQGGVVPGNSLRIVNIDETDTEACCGTHCDNTSEVGIIKMVGARRVTDGIVRLSFVAGERALQEMSRQSDMLHQLCTNLSVQQEHVVQSATDFFKQAIASRSTIRDLTISLIKNQVLMLSRDTHNDRFFVRTGEASAAIFISQFADYAVLLKETGKTIVFVGDNFLYAFSGAPEKFDIPALKATVDELKAAEETRLAGEPDKLPLKASQLTTKTEMQGTVPAADGKKASKVKVTGIAQLTAFNIYQTDKIAKKLQADGFVEL